MTRPLFNSGFEDDEFWAYGQDGFQEVLDSFIGSDVLIYDKAIGTEPQQVRAIVQQKTSDVYNSTTVRQILCNIGILRCGQYVKHDGAFWLVSSLPDNNRIYEKAVLWKCKYSIRFVSPLTGEIVEYPVYSTNSTQYGTGEAGKTQMTVGEDQHLIYLPYNEETIMLDTQTRFLMDKNKVDPTAYRITRVDPISYAVGDERAEDGLIQWAVLEDQFNAATDNAELMVADYYTSVPGGTEETLGASVHITLTDLDGDFKIAGGETKQIRVQVLDESGVPNKALLDTYDQTNEDLKDAVAKKHSHANKTELDKIVEGDKAKWDAAAAKAHEHANKTELDKIVEGDKANLDAVVAALTVGTF